MKLLTSMLTVMVMLTSACQTGRRLQDKPFISQETNVVNVIIHPRNFFSRYAKIYCGGTLVKTIRPLSMDHDEFVEIKDHGLRCYDMQFSVNDAWRQSLIYNGGTIHLVIDPVIIENSYLYVR